MKKVSNAPPPTPGPGQIPMPPPPPPPPPQSGKTAMNVVAKGHFNVADWMFEENIRVAQIIHVPSMVAGCSEFLPDQVTEFFDDIQDHRKTLHEGAATFLRYLGQVAPDVAKDERWRNEEYASWLGRQREIEYFVQVEWAIREYRNRGKRPMLGTFTMSWGHYRSSWFAGTTLNGCLKQGRILANSEHLKSWEKAPPELKPQ